MPVTTSRRKVVFLFVGLALLLAPYLAWKTYKHYDHEIHVYIESRPPLAELRDLVRLWPWPSKYLGCEEAAPSPIPRFESPGVLVADELYFLGGFDTPSLHATTRCDRYDPETDSWAPLSDLPAPVTHIAAARHERTIWIAGGFVGDHPGKGTDAVWKYEVDRDEWTPGVSLPEPRAAGGLAALDGKLHYFGGSMKDRSTDSGSHWILDIASEQPAWRSAAPLPFPRHHFGTTIFDGKIYVIGGQRNHDWAGPGMRAQVDTDRVHVYDPQQDSWSAVAALPRARAHIDPGAFVWKGKVCVAGGESGFAAALYNIDCYDPIEQKWVGMPGLPEPLRAPVVTPLEDRWFVGLGGVMPSGSRPTATIRLCREPS